MGSLSAVSEAPPREELGVETLWTGASDTALRLPGTYLPSPERPWHHRDSREILWQRQQSAERSAGSPAHGFEPHGRSSSSSCRHRLLRRIPPCTIDALDQQPERHGDQCQGQGCNHIWQVVLRQDDNQEVFDDEAGTSKDKDRAKRPRQVARTQNQAPAHDRRGAIEYGEDAVD